MKYMSKTLLLSLLTICFVGSVLVNPVTAQSRRRKKVSAAIPEDQRPSTAFPWFVGIILSAGVVVISLKNAKRSHLD